MGKCVPSRHQGDPLASGRVNQKRRTREAILDAARTLLDEGRVPSVGEAADAALVGRTTAYRYFPTQESLILEASMDSVVAVLDDTEGPADDTDGPDGDGAHGSGDPAERVDRVLRTMHGRIAEHEAAFRAIIRLSLEKQARLGPGDTGEVRLLEGRRLAWMQDALEPARDDLPADVHADLVAALAMLAGTESFIALKDACRVDDPHERSRIIRWTARMLLTGVLAHGAPAPGDDPAPG